MCLVTFQAAVCLVTLPDVWGPVYIPGMPQNSDELMNISKLILQIFGKYTTQDTRQYA